MTILIYCLGMLILCSGIGLLPLVICESKKTINIISLYGAGLLVGVAFIIIIPEASAALFQSLIEPTTQNKLSNNKSGVSSDQTDTFCKIMGLSIMAGFLLMYLINHLFSEEHSHEHNHEDIKEEEMGYLLNKYRDDEKEDSEILHSNSDNGNIIRRCKNKHSENQEDNDVDLSKTMEKIKNKEFEKIEHNTQNAFVTLIGLVVHSIADGVSFGCVSYAESTKNENMFQFVIFLAIIMHKIPSALGFTSFMMSQGLSKRKIVQYLITYTSAPPISSLVVYYCLYFIGNKLWKTDNMIIVGIFLLISAGSFIYVALLHILPEVIANCKESPDHEKKNDSSIGKNLQAILMVFGCCTPFLLYLVHDA